MKKNRGKIDELSENADDLLLESDQLESILSIAIFTVEHLVQMWLEPQRRPHPLLSALLALGHALEVVSEKEKADREQDERAEKRGIMGGMQPTSRIQIWYQGSRV